MTVRNCLEPLHPIHPTFKVDVKSTTPISVEIVDVFDLMMRLLEMKESLLVQMYSKDYNIIEQKKLSDHALPSKSEPGEVAEVEPQEDPEEAGPSFE